MNGRFSLKDFGRTPTIPGVLAYLEKAGWKTSRMQDRDVYRCEGPTDDRGEPIVQYLPASEKYPDYGLRLEDLVAAISTIEDRPAIDVVNAMREAPSKAKRSTLAG
jgi:hypothetical protein